MTTAFSSALYYPYIDIRNERWLRSATLFWDSIRTIVPASHPTPYSKNFARDLCDEGVLVPIRVSSDMPEIEDLTEKVLDFLTDPASAGVIYDTDKRPARRIHPEKMSHELRELSYLHPEKLPYMIRSELERGLDSEGWIHAEPGFANFYMTLLASQLSERLGLGLVTESSSADHLAVAVRKGKPLGTNSERRFGRHYDAYEPRRSLPAEISPGLLMDLMIQGISLPEHLSARDVLTFKRDHQEELSILRREIASLTADIPSDLPVEALRQRVSDKYQDNVLPAMNSLRRSLRAQSWEAGINGLLKVSFFSAAPTSAAIFAGIPSSIALLAGAGISLTASAVLLSNQRSRAKADSPYSYLLSLERQW